MMPKIRVLVVDDSVVIRRIVSDIVSSDPALEVAGIAANGRMALDRIPRVNPDIITLDVEMPEMDGLQTLKELRKTYPKLPVIMLSTVTSRGGIATIEALSLGASDYVTKAANVGKVGEGITRVRDELIPKIKALCGVRDSTVAKPPVPPLQTRLVASADVLSNRRLEILAIGVSTGGPNALAELMAGIPPDFPVPIVIVQHMPPVFTRLLADRLNANAAIPIGEAAAGTELIPGMAWIAPGDFHMVLEKSAGGARIALNKDAPENSCRPAVDPLFRSVVKVYGGAALGVILTGMGQDGLKGCQSICEAGGQVIAQDEASSVIWGMPGFVARAGIAEEVLPLSQIAGEIMRRAAAGRSRLGGGHQGLSNHGHFGR